MISNYAVKVELVESPSGDKFYRACLVDGLGEKLVETPFFYSRYGLRAKSYALSWYAEELFKLNAIHSNLSGLTE